ncbi:50S ribosomal protein L4 [Candidatus Peregrinibacteria bacterium]|nr:50S ribosomal protein L4 [Candidatus Peregrinibacteria bacterium]
MKIDVYSLTGAKTGTLELPSSLFEAPINQGLMHQSLILQQSNRRRPVAHAKRRSEVKGSTRKLYQQKGTGRARRGDIRSPLLRGGGKSFGPRKDRNFHKDMPKGMRRSALRSCLSWQAKNGVIIGLESGTLTGKTKETHALLKKLPIELGRSILFVLPQRDDLWARSTRNIPRVKTLIASYLNPEDVLKAHRLIFLTDAIKKAEEIFGKKAPLS